MAHSPGHLRICCRPAGGCEPDRATVGLSVWCGRSGHDGLCRSEIDAVVRGSALVSVSVRIENRATQFVNHVPACLTASNQQVPP